MEEEKVTCSFVFKKRAKRSQLSTRKRKGSEENPSSEDETMVMKKDRRAKDNPLVQKTNTVRKTKAVESASGSSDDDVMVSYKSKRTTGREGPSDMGATAVLQIETEAEKDAQAIFENALRINKELKGKEDDKVYRGMNNYAQYFEKRDTAQGNASSGMALSGRQPTFELLCGGTTNLTFVRITRKLVSVGLEIAVSSCMTVLTTSLGGSWNGKCKKERMVRQTMIHTNMKLIQIVMISLSSASSAGILSRTLL